MYEHDYIMRLVRDMVKFIAKVFLRKDDVKYELSHEEKLSQTDVLHKQLIILISEGRINEAENLLFENLDTDNTKYLELSIDFYNRLNEMEDDFLEESNFSRQEVEEGLRAIMKEFGISM